MNKKEKQETTDTISKLYGQIKEKDDRISYLYKDVCILEKQLSEAKKEIDSQNQAILDHVSDKDSLRARIEDLSNDIEVLNTNLKESQERWLIAVHKGFEKKEELREALKDLFDHGITPSNIDKCRKLIGE